MCPGHLEIHKYEKTRILAYYTIEKGDFAGNRRIIKMAPESERNI